MGVARWVHRGHDLPARSVLHRPEPVRLALAGPAGLLVPAGSVARVGGVAHLEGIAVSKLQFIKRHRKALLTEAVVWIGVTAAVVATVCILVAVFANHPILTAFRF